MATRTANGRASARPRFSAASPWIVLLLGVALSFWGWHQARGYSRDAAASRLQLQLHDRTAVFQTETQSLAVALDNVRLFLDHAGVVDRESFHLFTKPLLERNRALVALTWNPRVLHSDRQAFEDEGRAHGYPGFRITERQANAGETMMPAARRSHYFPVLWVEPRTDYENALGFDVLSEANRRTAIELSARTNQLTVTAPIQLGENDNSAYGVLAVLPQFRPRSEANQPSGVITGVVRVQDLLDRALSAFEDLPFDLEVWDISSPAGPRRVAQATPHAGTRERVETGSYASAFVSWGGRVWEARAFPTQDFLHASAAPILLGIAGLLLSALAAIYVATLNKRRHRAERLVRNRTSELAAANATLRTEAAQRIAAQEQLTEHQSQLEEHVEERTRDLRRANSALKGEVELRTRAEKALHGSNHSLRLTLEAVSEGVGDWDLEGGQFFLSDRALETLGFNGKDVTAAEERTRIWEDSLHPDDRPRHSKALIDCIKGDSDRLEVVVRRHTRTGECLWFEELGKVVARDASGQALRMLATSRDVTRRMQAKQEKELLDRRMREAQKLESLGILSGGIAHDFNNLLAGMMGNVELAIAKSASDPQITSLLNETHLGGARAAELVQQMLAYTGKAPFKVERLDLAEIVQEMLALLTASISKKAELIVDTNSAPVEGDPVQIRQVVMNLITNASEALPDEGGEIVITTGSAAVSSKELIRARAGGDLKPGNYPFLEVRDTGVGMDEHVLAQMFDPFFSTKLAGRGLGLAATLGIVQGHSGALFIDSIPDQGTCARVVFQLPTVKQPKSQDAQTSTSTAMVSGQTVLVIDDEPILRKLMRISLEAAGLTVLQARNGLEGLEIVTERAEQISLIIVDATMPVMDGAQFLAAVKSVSKVPVILTSGYSELDLRQQFSAPDISGFLAKPFRIEELLSLVSNLLAIPEASS